MSESGDTLYHLFIINIYLFKICISSRVRFYFKYFYYVTFFKNWLLTNCLGVKYTF